MAAGPPHACQPARYGEAAAISAGPWENAMVSEPRLTLITRPGCHLCEMAKEAIDRVVVVTGDRWIEVDVTGDLELEREYGDRVPVVLLDGKEHGYWRVEEDRLLRDLAVAG
jgi:glutaredoxin